MFRPLAVLFTCAFAASCLVAQDIPKLRLSGDVRPVRYEMDLKVVPSADGYSGHIAIEAEIKRSVNTVWLHATDLKLTKAVVGSRTATVVSGGKEFVGLQLPSAAPAGKTRIEIDFSGTFNKNDVEGFFKQSDNGNSYVLSQFEPTSARRAFPCFDEPAMKVPWKL
ncbi:MAG: hypothetical protein H7039_04585, partial [Bryobacteraceae bacterium]|nr:hypothetical protein [Bryobacteraceae bacterium]